jgi:hypothetical protein
MRRPLFLFTAKPDTDGGIMGKTLKRKIKHKPAAKKKHWYWSRSCQRMERAADKDIKAGRIKRCLSAKELKRELCK